MSVINTSSFAKALFPGINQWYGRGYDEFPVEYTGLFDTDVSHRRYEEDVGVSSFGLGVVKAEGEGVSYDTEKQGFTTRYGHIVIGLGFIITREMYEDDLYDQAGKNKARGLAFSMRQTKEIICANIYNRAFSSLFLGSDGVALCSTAHVNIGSATWSNKLLIDADLSEGSLEQGCIDLAKFTNDRGLRIAVMPECLVVPPDYMFEAERILKSPARVGTANNDLNALKEMGKFPQGIKMNHYLTDNDAWFIRTNVPDAMRYFQRRPMEFTIDYDFATENAKYKALERYSAGWSDPRGVYGSAGA